MPFSGALEILDAQRGMQRDHDVAFFRRELYGCIDMRAERAPDESREVEEFRGEALVRCGAEQVEKSREDIDRLDGPVLDERQEPWGHDLIELDRF